MEDINIDAPDLRRMKLKEWCFKVLSAILPVGPLRRAYLRAFYQRWEADNPAFNRDWEDVYDVDISWTDARALPTEEADRRLAIYDARVEEELDFVQLLQHNL